MSNKDASLELDELLAAAVGGDLSAAGRILDLHRERLTRAVALRLDPRLAARLDPSDVVQEALADASAKIIDYARERPLPLYPWLYRLAMEQVAEAYRRHVAAGKRSVKREDPGWFADRDGSSVILVERLVDREPSPGSALDREAKCRALHEALATLPELDHEILVMRYLEACSFVEIAAILGIGESAARMRHLRAIVRMKDVLQAGSGE
jgi:RNA polymerase sigma-70 factor (ECF subfamily)